MVLMPPGATQQQRHGGPAVEDTAHQSLEATRRMINYCEESKDAGIRTLVALDEQGEQLERVEEDLDKINKDMREAEKNLTGMEKFCGLCICPCGKGAKQLREDAKTWQNGEDDGRVVSVQPRVADKRDQQAPPTGPYIAHINHNAREREMERNMQQVHMMVGNLRNMAIDMGSEIESQNAQLDRINLKASSNQSRVAVASVQTNKLLQK